jgi:hypothetical protein
MQVRVLSTAPIEPKTMCSLANRKSASPNTCSIQTERNTVTDQLPRLTEEQGNDLFAKVVYFIYELMKDKSFSPNALPQNAMFALMGLAMDVAQHLEPETDVKQEFKDMMFEQHPALASFLY